MNIYIYEYIYIYMNIWIYEYMNIYIYMHIYMNIWIYEYMNMYIYIYEYTYIYIYNYMNIYIYGTPRGLPSMSFPWYLLCFLIIFGDWFWTVVSTVFCGLWSKRVIISIYIYSIIASVWISVLRLNVALRMYKYAYIRVQPRRVDTCTTLGCILDSKIPRFQDLHRTLWVNLGIT